MAEKIVKTCKSSNIGEAWCVVKGTPGPRDPFEPQHLLVKGKDKYGDLQLSNTLSVVKDGSSVAPFWSEQVKWNSGKHVCRFGHRFLSVHRLVNEVGDKYSSFEADVEPAARAWLEIYRAPSTPSPTVASVAFGYKNIFDFAPDVDLFEYFNIRFGIKSLSGLTLVGIDLNFILSDTKDFFLHACIKNRPAAPHSKTVRFETKIFARRNTANLTFAETEKILGITKELKHKARESFFAFVTDKTKDEILQAEYA